MPSRKTIKLDTITTEVRIAAGISNVFPYDRKRMKINDNKTHAPYTQISSIERSYNEDQKVQTCFINMSNPTSRNAQN